jgi:hypothetical protein
LIPEDPVTSRRKILYGIGGAILSAWALVFWVPSRRRLIVDERQDTTGSEVEDTENADQLLQDLSRLAARDYSEEGVAVFLACENLAEMEHGKPTQAFVPSALNQQLSGDFNRYARMLPQLRPEVSEADIAALLELLAYRDLAAADRALAP